MAKDCAYLCRQCRFIDGFGEFGEFHFIHFNVFANNSYILSKVIIAQWFQYSWADYTYSTCNCSLHYAALSAQWFHAVRTDADKKRRSIHINVKPRRTRSRSASALRSSSSSSASCFMRLSSIFSSYLLLRSFGGRTVYLLASGGTSSLTSWSHHSHHHSGHSTRRASAECRGATTAEKLRGTKVWVPTPGRLRPAPGQRPGWVLGAGGGRPLIPGKFLKTQMLNGPTFLGTSLPRSLRLLRLWPSYCLMTQCWHLG